MLTPKSSGFKSFAGQFNYRYNSLITFYCSKISMDCIFCKIANKTVPTELLLEDDECVAFRDIHPQAPTHVLIIPKKHLHSLNDANHEDQLLLGRLLLNAQLLAKQLGHADKGYRLVINTGDEGGQTVHHIHLHLIAGKQMHWPPG